MPNDLHALECISERLVVIQRRIPYQASLNILLAIYWLQMAAKMMDREEKDGTTSDN